MRCVGLIGGTSWHSTIVYYKRINEHVNSIRGAKVNPPLVIYNINQQYIHHLQSIDSWDMIAQIYVAASNNLIAAGAEAIAFCANTPHKIADIVQSKIEVPILHIVDNIGRRANKLDLNKLILLGTKFTMQDTFWITRFKSEYNIEIITPSTYDSQKIHSLVIDDLTAGVFSDNAKHITLDTLTKYYKSHKADGVILGCTEFPILLANTEFPIPFLDSTNLHVESIVDFILS